MIKTAIVMFILTAITFLAGLPGIWLLTLILGIVFLIMDHEKKQSDRRYELEKYKAETERMKAEAAQSNQDNSSADL